MVDEQPEAVKRSAQDDTRPTSPVQSTGRLDTGQGKTDAFLTERTATSGDYLRIFTYATKLDFLASAAGALAAAGCGVTTPLMYVLFGNFVNNFGNFDDQYTTGSGDQFRETLDELCLYLFALFLARLVLATIHKLAFRMIGIRLSSAIRLHYLKRLLGQSVHVLDSLPSGHAANTITSSSNTLQLGISEKLGVLIEYTALSIGAIAVAFSKNWELALVTSSGIVLITLIVGAIFPLVVKGQTLQARAENGAAAVASEAFASIRMIMACGAEQRTANKYGSFVSEAHRHAQRTSPITSIQFAITFFGVFGTVGLTFWYGARALTQARLESAGVITVVLLSITTVFFSLDSISGPVQAISKASLAACDFFSVIDAPWPRQGHVRAPEVSAREDIVFENVTFAYPGRPHVKALDGLDLRIQAGKTTAIVGPSGSGKSTIVGLIECWYTLQQQHVIPHAVGEDKKKHREGGSDEVKAMELQPIGPLVELEGSVSTCGRSLQDMDVKWWRSQIGLVQQDPSLFDDTIYNNVAQGLVGSRWENEPVEQKRALVRRACEEAFASEFIRKLPQRYDTIVGDGGAKLSGGQRQRLAIARAIVRKPAILILDEATSAIDVRSERIVQAALDEAARGRTTIVIAHRLSTIRGADQVVVLQDGKVIESGSHDSLVSIGGGFYAGLLKSQALSLSLDSPLETGTNSVEEDVTSTKQDTEGRPILLGHDGSLEEAARDERKTRHGLFNSFGTFFAESRACWGMITLSIMFAAGAGAARPLYAWLFAKSIAIFKYQDEASRLMDEARFIGGMWAVFAASAGITYLVAFVTSARAASAIRAKYQEQYFEAILFQPAAYFHEAGHSPGTLASRVKDDPMKLEELMGINMAMVLVSMFNIVASVIMALAYAWKLALVSICAIAPVCLVSGYFRFRYELQFERMNDEVFAETSQFASEAIGAFRIVSALTLEDSIAARFERLSSDHVRAAYRKARWVSPILGFCDSANLGCQSLVFYYGGQLLGRGDIGLVAFFVCLMAIMSAAEGFGQSLSFGPNAAQVTTASNRILDARDSRIAPAGHGDEASCHDEEASTATGGGMEIEFRNVSFKYPGRETPVFTGLSLTVERGQFVAIVGASGCGKTSILSLLEGFYQPNGGQILCDGQDIAAVDVFAHRSRLSLVAQESMLLQGTIRDNILLGVDAPATITDDHLYAVCRDALIHDFIVSLPEGYDTTVGSRGVSLSGGQRQRIAIARALVRNPRVLLLDEATSSLDSQSEKLVQEALERASRGRTLVMVAHRLATVQKAAVIFVLGEGGRLLEKGSHAELLKNHGAYYHMCIH